MFDKISIYVNYISKRIIYMYKSKNYQFFFQLVFYIGNILNFIPVMISYICNSIVFDHITYFLLYDLFNDNIHHILYYFTFNHNILGHIF